MLRLVSAIFAFMANEIKISEKGNFFCVDMILETYHNDVHHGSSNLSKVKTYP